MTKKFDINEVVNEVERLNKVLSENKVPHIIAVDKPDNKYCLAAAGNVSSITRLLSAAIKQNATESGVPVKDFIGIIKIGLGIEDISNTTEPLIEDLKKQAVMLAKTNLEQEWEAEDFRKNVDTQIELLKAIAALTALPKLEDLKSLLESLGDDGDK